MLKKIITIENVIYFAHVCLYSDRTIFLHIKPNNNFMIRTLKVILLLVILINYSCKKSEEQPIPITRIDYKKESIPDFSYVGYKKSEVSIPFVKEEIVLDAEGDNDYKKIQDAINSLAERPLTNGFRGAILLKAGTYYINNTLKITSSGIVLRGEGQGQNGTILIDTRSGKSIPSQIQLRKEQSLIALIGNTKSFTSLGLETRIQTDDVKAGSTKFEIANNPGFNVGDTILVIKTTNSYWIQSLGMEQYGWVADIYQLGHPRVISKIEDNTVYINIPMVDQVIDKEGGGKILKISYPGRISNSGVENLRVESVYSDSEDEMHVWNAIHLIGVENCWVRNVTGKYFAFSLVGLYNESSFNTIQDCAMLEPKSIPTGNRRYPFYIDKGTGNLFQRCYSDHGRHDFATGSRVAGPNVFLDGYAPTSLNETGPHHRWATGTLYDNIYAGIIAARNREASGDGHGWSGAFNMFWNCVATVTFKVENPPGAINWLIGGVGNVAGDSYTASIGHPVEPRSLFIKQLTDRIGEAKVRDIVIDKQIGNNTIWKDLGAWAGNAKPLKTIY